MTRSNWRWMAMAAFAAVGVLTAVSPALAQPEMSAEEKAMMEAWTKAMTPGAEHALLASRTGTWDATVTSWWAPGTPPQVSQAKAVRKMALGGRVLMEEWTGTMMGAPFEGLGLSGYDNVSKSWWGTWNDNMGTGLMTMKGTCDADMKKGCTHTGTFMDPMTGKQKTTRSVSTWSSATDEKMEMFDKGPDGKEFKTMEIVMKKSGN